MIFVQSFIVLNELSPLFFKEPHWDNILGIFGHGFYFCYFIVFLFIKMNKLMINNDRIIHPQLYSLISSPSFFTFLRSPCLSFTLTPDTIALSLNYYFDQRRFQFLLVTKKKFTTRLCTFHRCKSIPCKIT